VGAEAPAGEVHQNTRPAPGATPGAARESAARRGTVNENRKGTAEERGENKNIGQAPRRETTGQAPQNEGRERATEEKKSEPNRAGDERPVGSRNVRDNERGERDDRGARGVPDNRGARGNDRTQTTGQGAASTRRNVSVNITSEQRTRIHEIVIKERSAPRVEHVDFSLSVGTVVPRSIRIVTIPRAIIEIEPEWDGFDYFMVGEEIIIVNPRSMEIVAILEA
jgi:hypothetical protein